MKALCEEYGSSPGVCEAMLEVERESEQLNAEIDDLEKCNSHLTDTIESLRLKARSALRCLDAGGRGGMVELYLKEIGGDES